MSYKIAVASSDEEQIDLSFGAAECFLIYEVDGLEYRFAEKRALHLKKERPFPAQGTEGLACGDGATCGDGLADGTEAACGDGVVGFGCGNGAGAGCGDGSGAGCGAGGPHSEKVDLIADCRCVVCKKVGFQAQKQLEKLAISTFDIACPVKEALDKIVPYLYRTDQHQSLRGIQKR